MTVSAKVICDSKFQNTRLTTLEIELHRFILPEFNTHRTLSRNFQSSRAVPIKQMIEQVRNDPAMPVHWGKNQPGMVAESEFDKDEALQVKASWLLSALSAARHAEEMLDLGAHKQIVNRILEPFMWTKGVVTGTQKAWGAFLALRAHKDAQPEIQALAFKIQEALEDSQPEILTEGDWHLPYIEEGGGYSVEEAIKVSASCCAQVSYRRLDESLEKAHKIYEMLNLPENGCYPENPPHFSPTEHIAKAGYFGEVCSGNFNTPHFYQYRKALEAGNESGLVKLYEF